MIGPLSKIFRASNLFKIVLRYFGKVWHKPNVCIIRFDWLISLYIFTPLPCNASFLIVIFLCQRRSQWCQQITVQEHLFGEFALVNLTFGSWTSPNDTAPFTYQPFNVPGMCAEEKFQPWGFGNSWSPEKFTGKPKIVSLPTSSQESVKHKSLFTFTFTLYTIYEVNGTAQYPEKRWTATDNDTTLAALLQQKEDDFSKLAVKNRSKIDRNKSVPKKW